MEESNQNPADEHPATIGRREALKAMGATVAMAAGGVATAASKPTSPVATNGVPPAPTLAAGSQAAVDPAMPRNPYGGGPSAGLTLPPYFRPTASLKNNNNYFPGTEELAADEMRISFVGSVPFPTSRQQAGTCIMVELGNGKRFFFDFGSGCLRNIIAMQVPVQVVNDIFLTHLHVDHYAELPYLYAFAPWMARWKPLRVHGPSGRTPKDGVKAMIEGMKQMTHWHTDSFNSFPIGDGYEVEVNEFDFKDDNGMCYNKDGVIIRHWRRSHTKDGAVAYRLDWNGLSFCWTGDGMPDKLTEQYAKGVDVFVTEAQPDLGNLYSVKFGVPPVMLNTTIDSAHTTHYGAGYLIKQVNPRIGMITHMSMDESTIPEVLAGVRTHWDGLFQFGGPDVMVVNVTKEAIWTRRAALPESAMPIRPSPKEAAELFDLGLTKMDVVFPNKRHRLADIQEQFVRDQEIDPKKMYPPNVFRQQERNFPDNFKISILQMVWNGVKQKFFGK